MNSLLGSIDADLLPRIRKLAASLDGEPAPAPEPAPPPVEEPEEQDDLEWLMTALDGFVWLERPARGPAQERIFGRRYRDVLFDQSVVPRPAGAPDWPYEDALATFVADRVRGRRGSGLRCYPVPPDAGPTRAIDPNSILRLAQRRHR